MADPVGSPGFAAPDQGALRLSLPVLPSVAGAAPDPVLTPQPDPPAAGTVYARDARGFVLATAAGTLTPTGIMVFAGLPAVVPPNRPGSAVALPAVIAPVAAIAAIAAPPLAPRDALTPPADAGAGPDPGAATPVGPDTTVAPVTAGGVGLAALAPLVRPLLRPDTALPGSDLPPVAVLPVMAAYAGPRPALRPAGLTPQTAEAAAALPATDPAADPATDPAADPIADPSLAVADTVAAILAAAPADPLATATALAVSSARLPEPRPQNFAAVVAAAEARNAAPPEDVANASLAVTTAPPQVAPDVVDPAPVAAAAVAPAQVAPAVVAASGPVSGGVATAATLEQAIDLRSVNLIGVFGRPNDRRALVRLSNGRYVRVAVGDSLDGGQVAAIGDNALNYVKRGQTITIAIPNG